MRRVSLGLAVLGIAIGVIGSAACADDGATAQDANDAVRIESISPSYGTIGTEITIRGSGFDLTRNDIGFRLSDSGSFKTGFITGIPSPDGRRLVFELEETMGACAFTQLGPNEACPAIGLRLQAGDTEVSVHNVNGTSRSVRFTREISRLEAAEDEIHQSPEYAALTERLDGLVAASYSPSSGTYEVSYGIGIRESGAYVYIELSVFGVELSDLPSEIAGYGVRVQ